MNNAVIRAHRKTSTALTALALLGGSSLLALSPAMADSPSDLTSDCSLPSGVLDVEDLPDGSSTTECDATGRVVANEAGLAVEVPEPGNFAYVEAVHPDGITEAFGVTIASDGELQYTDETHADSPGVPDAADLAEAALDDDALARVAAPAECSQSQYNLLGFKWYNQTYSYRMGDGPRPAGLTSAEFKDAIIDSANNITKAHNDCGRADNVSATQSYAGTTTHESFVTNANGKLVCRDADGISVVDAGDLQGGAWAGAALGIACVRGVAHSGPDSITEVDIRLNTSDYNWTTTPRTASCKTGANYKTWRFDVKSVLTHEFGHGFGLDHVSESTYPKMTMSTATSPCTRSARTLGKGDMLGLEALY